MKSPREMQFNTPVIIDFHPQEAINVICYDDIICFDYIKRNTYDYSIFNGKQPGLLRDGKSPGISSHRSLLQPRRQR